MRESYLVLIIITVAFFMYEVGFAAAHQEIKTECNKLGGFFVGDNIFKCERVSQ